VSAHIEQIKTRYSKLFAAELCSQQFVERLMKLPHRRQFLHLAAGSVALPAVSRIARAQTYPARPVRVIVSVAAGGSADIVARLMGQWLSERLGQQFIIDNRPGGGNNIGAEAAINAAPDGYTLYLANSANAINATLYQKLKFNFIRDITPVAAIIRFPNVMEVNPSVPAKSVPDLIAYAKANPGKLNFASSGNGSTIHMSGELFKMLTGVDMVHVPYRGAGPALTDLLSGQMQVMFDNMPSSIEFIRDGRLRPLAVTTATRWEGLPDLPSVSEFVPGFEASAWFGVSAPKNTPVGIVEKLNKEINSILADTKVKARLVDLGGTVLRGSPAEFGKLIADDTEKWGKVVKAVGIKAE
jgi:tripartite-type tricarboxylate transporter receptor subunit TctC